MGAADAPVGGDSSQESSLATAADKAPRLAGINEDKEQVATTASAASPDQRPDTTTSAADAVASPRPTHWPELLPTPLGLSLENSSAKAGPRGEAWLRHWVPRDTIGSAYLAWLDALERADAALDSGCRARGAADCSFQLGGRSGRLSSALSGGGSSHGVLVVQLGSQNHVPIAKLPGPCVIPGDASREVTVQSGGIDQKGEYGSSSVLWSVAAYSGPDLDGDGIGERLVPQQSKERCPWSIPYDVYVMRGSCGHKIGSIIGFFEDDTYLAPFVSGLRVISTRAEWAAYGSERPEPIHHTLLRTYEFDGRKLVMRREDHREGVCHHCGVASCG